MSIVIPLGMKELTIVKVENGMGEAAMAIEAYGRCPWCDDAIYLARPERSKVTVPLKYPNKDQLHKCDGSVKNHPELRKLLGKV